MFGGSETYLETGLDPKLIPSQPKKTKNLWIMYLINTLNRGILLNRKTRSLRSKLISISNVHYRLNSHFPFSSSISNFFTFQFLIFNSDFSILNLKFQIFKFRTFKLRIFKLRIFKFSIFEFLIFKFQIFKFQIF